MRASRKLLAAGLVILSSLATSSLAWGDPYDTQSVSYQVISFRFLALSQQDGEDCTSPDTGTATASALVSASPSQSGDATVWKKGCAATFPAMRRGDISEVSGGLLYYATTLPNDKIEVALDSDMLNDLVLGVYVADTLATGAPCVSVGSTMTGAARTIVSGGATQETIVAPVVLSSTTPKALITGIGNCGGTGTPATASINYVLDAAGATPEADQSADETVSAIKQVTYTLKAGS